MVTDNLFDATFARLARVLDLRAEQHSLISANLANSNTPNYRAKELDFSQVLEDVMGSSSERLSMTNTAEGHLGGLSGINAQAEITTHEPPAWSIDGNSVNPEVELTRSMENNLMFNAVTRVTSRKLGLLKLAVMDGRL
mgnify:CR=1 FL=1